VDNGKLPILDGYWMKDIDYKYRASNKTEFQNQYNTILTDDFETQKKEFEKLKDGLKIFTNKQNWINQILEII